LEVLKVRKLEMRRQMRFSGVDFAGDSRKGLCLRTERTSGVEGQSPAKDAKLISIVVHEDIETAWSGDKNPLFGSINKLAPSIDPTMSSSSSKKEAAAAPAAPKSLDTEIAKYKVGSSPCSHPVVVSIFPTSF
jgi:hypothetical protein